MGHLARRQTFTNLRRDVADFEKERWLMPRLSALAFIQLFWELSYYKWRDGTPRETQNALLISGLIITITISSNVIGA